jgi:hypothetical protein
MTPLVTKNVYKGKYDKDGRLSWRGHLAGPSLCLQERSNIYVIMTQI